MAILWLINVVMRLLRFARNDNTGVMQRSQSRGNTPMRLEDLMKKFILIIVTIAFFIYPSICFSSYLIELKNGSTFITNHYWKEGRQIKFYYRGGIVGINRNLVRKIRESDLPYKEAVVEEKAPPTPDVPEVAPKEAGEKAGEKTDAESKEIDVEYYQRMNEELWEKYREANEIRRQAKTDHNQPQYDQARQKIIEVINKLSELSSELKEKNKGVLPDWWQDKP